ncbi:MAG: glycosyltransferase [Sedimenticolaceae bacterium]
MRIDYLFTTFPTLSETFYQREVRALFELGELPNLYSLWGGEDTFERHPVHLFSKWTLLGLFWWLPYWFGRKPAVMAKTLGRLIGSGQPAWLNFGETMLGLGFAVTHAHRFRHAGDKPAIIHAAWATGPGTAAQLIAALTDRKFCQGAHAYDIFRDGGDWWLDSKLVDAEAVITSSNAGREALLARGAREASTHLIRRGLSSLPALSTPRSPRRPLRILSVGRLVEKKGFRRQLEIYHALSAAGVAFEARIIGGGPLRRSLQAAVHKLGLSASVTLKGAQSQEETARNFQWADVFLFTGVVAQSGDRDGLPNVIPEAMAAGVPVISTPVGGVPEALEHRVSGLMLDLADTGEWVSALQRLSEDDGYYESLRRTARTWVEREFNAKRNAEKLLKVWRGIAQPKTAVGSGKK